MSHFSSDEFSDYYGDNEALILQDYTEQTADGSKYWDDYYLEVIEPTGKPWVSFQVWVDQDYNESLDAYIAWFNKSVQRATKLQEWAWEKWNQRPEPSEFDCDKDRE